MSWMQRLILVCLSLPVAAQSADVFVPDQLQGWEEWVLHDKDYRECPFYFNGSAAARGAGCCPSPSIARTTGRTKTVPQTSAETGFPGRPTITALPMRPAISGLPGRIAIL